MSSGTKVIVIGAGPAGLLASLRLSRLGISCCVFDSAKELQFGHSEGSYAVGVNPRGMRAIESVGKSVGDEVRKVGHPVDRFVIMKGEKKFGGIKSSITGTTRGSVVSALYREALTAQSMGHPLQIKLSHKLTSVDIKDRRLTFDVNTDDGKKTEKLVVDASESRVLDCSGCWSKCRNAIDDLEDDEEYRALKRPWGMTFRNLLTDESIPEENFPVGDQLIFLNDDVVSYFGQLTDKRWFLAMGVKNDSPQSWMLEDEGSEERAAELKEFVKKYAPPAVPFIPEDEYSKFFTRRTFTGQVVVPARLNAGEWLCLLGDSAHAVFPSTGEGINAAMDDVFQLMEALEAAGGPAAADIGANGASSGWFARYNRARLDDVRAVSSYAKDFVDSLYFQGAEKTQSDAARIVSSIFKKWGFFEKNWAHKTYGLQAGFDSYSSLHKSHLKQMKLVQPIAKMIAWFAHGSAKKQKSQAA